MTGGEVSSIFLDAWQIATSTSWIRTSLSRVRATFPLCSKVCDMFIKILLISSILEVLKNQIELSISGTWCRVLRAWKCACGTVFMTVLDSGLLTVYICNCRRVSVFNKDWFVSCRRRPAAVSSSLFIIFFCWQLYWSSRILVVMVTDMLYSPPRLIGPYC